MSRLEKGRVFLVGAGPGDPRLITVKGLDCIRKADVVVYDRLASPRLLHHMKPGADKIYVGKLPDRHTMRQEDINRLLVDLALEGKTVTRLKGGDPSIFGRVGEEAELLVDHGIPFEIVPGITSAIAVPTYAGIPVTHRDKASSFSVVTGHESPDKLDQNIYWDKVTNATGTLIFLMGVAKIGYIADQLMRHGRPATTPVALIRWGTRVEQQTIVGTLETIEAQVKAANFQPPAVIVVGDVVSQRDKLQWYEKMPLFGKRVLVTRARAQASDLAERIDELGGEALEFPVIRIQPPSDPAEVEACDEALRRLGEYDWTIFTSPNGVEYFFRRMRELGLDVRSMIKARIAAVGPKTAEALQERGLTLAISLPAKFQQEGLFEALRPELLSGQQVLLPRGDLARAYLADQLREADLGVTEVDVYETVITNEHADELIEYLQNGEIQIITFTSSSTVTNLLRILSGAGITDPAALLQGVEIACIGPVTAKTASEAGLAVSVVSEEATIDSLVESLVAHSIARNMQ